MQHQHGCNCRCGYRGFNLAKPRNSTAAWRWADYWGSIFASYRAWRGGHWECDPFDPAFGNGPWQWTRVERCFYPHNRNINRGPICEDHGPLRG